MIFIINIPKYWYNTAVAPHRNTLIQLDRARSMSTRSVARDLSQFDLQETGTWQAERSGLELAILETVAYADVFDFPLTEVEIHRSLIGSAEPLESVRRALADGAMVPVALARTGEYYTLPGRASLVQTRRERAEAAARLWPQAISYGKRIAQLPFVRMVAVTGSLAVNNADPGADLDYLVVTAPGRLWICRALTILVVRWAGLHGHKVCPNYLISENVLAIDQHNLYSAHELVQMIPLCGYSVYRRMQAQNDWVGEYLPNAMPFVDAAAQNEGRIPAVRKIGEAFLGAPVFDPLERWEMERKVRRFGGSAGAGGEASFSSDWCKGHFDGHYRRTAGAFHDRLEKLNAGIGWRSAHD